MTPEEKKLVTQSFEQVLPIADLAASLFYNRLFELDPALRSMFRGDMQEQGRKLMLMLRVAVANQNRLDVLIPAVGQLGVRHGAYGVQRAHYATVGAALLWTLEQGLGPAFTPEVCTAWTTVYTTLSTIMQQAAVELPAAA
jgi:hemoglobin-like flavoprotein